MNFEIEGQRSSCLPKEMTNESHKNSKVSYTREFLISLSGLDICKKLPSGFNQSIISALVSEFEDSSHDRQRISGGVSINSFRRSDYGSSPPTRGDSTSYSWGNHGRWESRSSGRSGGDSDSQPNWDSDSGRRFDNQSRHSQQGPEHDGLLGSGSFPRSSGFAAGVSMPKVRPNDQYQLNKTNEPYHPPRPYKAPHSRKGIHDSYNDETFGSSECTNEDRVEEERKRRESFELMRKEQQKTFQENQKFDTERKKYEFDITILREDSKDSKRKNTSNVEEPAAAPASDTSSEKSYFPSQMAASRPVVPPGFTSTIVDRNLGAKSLNHPHAAVAGESEVGVNQIDLSKQQDGNTSSHALINDHSGKALLDAPNVMIGGKSIFHKRSDLSKASEDSETIEPNVAKVKGNSILGKSNEDSASLLDKFFGSPLALTGGGSSTTFGHQESKSDETWSPRTVQSSKFSHWFRREEKETSNDLSSGKPNDLLSLIVGGAKDGSRVSQINGNILQKIPFQIPDSDEKLASNVMPAPVGKAEHLYTNIKPEAVSSVLTCEDLEQTILSEIGDNGSVMQPSVQSSTDPYGKKEQPKACVDDSASQHLLSLLQKGTCLRDLDSSQKLDAVSPGNLQESKGASTGTAFYGSRDADVERVSDSANSLTLETLFGTAFMKELQSVGAPVSVQRVPSESLRFDVADAEPRELGIPGFDNALHSSNGIEFNVSIPDTSLLKANRRMHFETDRTEEQWLNFDVPSVGLHTPQLRSNRGTIVGGFDAPANVHLTEVDSSISVSDPLNAQNFVASRSSVKTELLSSQAARTDMALGSILKNGRPVRGQEQSFLPVSFDSREPDLPYQNFHVQPSSTEFHHHKIHSQMKFMAPEAVLQHDPRPNHQFSANILRPSFPHPSTGLSGFDQPVHHPMLQHMHMPGNLPPHLLPGMSRGPTPPHPNRGVPHPNHQVTGFIQDVNPVPGLPFGHQQPNFGSIGMAQPVELSAPDVGGGSNHPEALQRLIEMELRANAKQIYPLAAADNQSQEMYGRGPDMGFRYR